MERLRKGEKGSRDELMNVKMGRGRTEKNTDGKIKCRRNKAALLK